MIRLLGTWLRGGRYRFVIPVVLLMMLQTVVLALLGGWTTVIVGGLVIVALEPAAGSHSVVCQPSRGAE